MKTIIFDFDGTLADTTAGILHCFKKTVKEMGLPCPSDGASGRMPRLRSYLGQSKQRTSLISIT